LADKRYDEMQAGHNHRYCGKVQDLECRKLVEVVVDYFQPLGEDARRVECDEDREQNY